MDPLVLAAGTALVGAMATDAWQQTRTAVISWWRQFHPHQAEAVNAELATVRAQVLVARDRGDEDTEEALIGAWRLRLQRLLDENPEVGPELQRLLEEQLAPPLSAGERSLVQQIIINAQARDNARQNIAGRDLRIADS